MREKVYIPALLANGEIWEGYWNPDDTFTPVVKSSGAQSKEQLVHVDDKMRVVRAPPGSEFLRHPRPATGPGSMKQAQQQYSQPSEPGNPPMPGTESVESIAAMITEDIRPGTLGIVEKDQKQEKKGDHKQVQYLARYIIQYANKFHEAADMGDLEQARLCMAQVQGAVEQAKEHIELLAKEKGLPNLSV